MLNIVRELNKISMFSALEKSFAIMHLKSSPKRAKNVMHIINAV